MKKKPANENLNGTGGEDEQSSEAGTQSSTETIEDAMMDQEAIAAGRRETIVRLMEAMRDSEQGPISARIVNETLLALAVSVFVRTLGREGAAMLIERLPEKIRNGEFGDSED